ncbi:hypothetical protein [Burkholderia cenocepacia]|uniref:hypothetical protein n=1 Tax=Burkholderia cenocepacia TaxID=95486 RepID=UPI001CF41A0D|nr:hypothetical protein [Burkholderia cenocepacia]MCA8234056.1 hypothetical protein [Burkholderia cenocepacia]
MYTDPTLEHMEGIQRVLADYYKLMEAPRIDLAWMSVRFEPQLDASRLTVVDDEFLGGGLRHAKFGPGDLSKVNSAEQHMKALFGGFESVTELDDPGESRAIALSPRAGFEPQMTKFAMPARG